MPSMTHEGLLSLVRANPHLFLQLAAGDLGMSADDITDVHTTESSFSELMPAEFNADSVLCVSERDDKCSRAVVLEVQLRPDLEKHYSWPHYITGVRCRLRCPVGLLVIAIKRSVADWCAQPIHTGHEGFVLKPVVLGPDRIPVITDIEQACGHPELAELAVLSAAAHGAEPGAEHIALAALAASSALDSAQGALYADLVYSFLGEAARRALEDLMQQEHYEYQSEFARRYVAQGRAEGKAEGRAEGRAEGEAKGKAEGLLLALEIKGFEVSEALRERILSCTDPAQLDTWYSRVKSAQKLEDIFA